MSRVGFHASTSIDLDKTHRRCGILNVNEEINKILIFSSQTFSSFGFI